MGNGCGKHAGTNSIYCPSHNAVHENMGFAPFTAVDRVLQLHVIATTLVQDFYFLQLPRMLSSSSLLLMMLTKSFLDALTHGMGDVANFLLDRPTLRGILRENGWATSCWPHLDLQYRYIFCGVRLTQTRNTEVQDCIDPTASYPEWKVSFSHHSWSLKKQAVHRGSHLGQCAVYLMPM